MKNTVLIFLGLLVLSFTSCINPKSFRWSFTNPDNTIIFTLLLEKSSLYYTVNYLNNNSNRTAVIEKSPLGLVREDDDFTRGLKFVTASDIHLVHDRYSMKIGKQLKIHGTCNEQVFTFQNKNHEPIQIIARIYPDGVAFRYAFPGTSGKTLKLTGDETGFNLPIHGETWISPYMKVDTWAPAYESIWENGIPIGTTSPDSAGWSFPALFNVGDNWILLTEAGLDTTCFGSHLQPAAAEGLYKIRLPENDETYGIAPREATIRLPWESPWRTIIVGKTPGTIQESNIVYNLSPPCALADTSWIKPGRVSWSWWSDNSSPADYKKLVPFIDLSARMGWEYSLIDANWHHMKNGTIEQLIEYAKSKGVGLILWYNSGGKHNRVSDACPCDIMNDPAKRATEMKKLQQWGIKGIKIDFMQSDKQYIIKLYHDIILDAARHHLVVDFHGATIPRGWSRTYPNLLTMEGIRGAEQYWDTVFAENAHTYNTIYTFTRNVIGPMDYTPVIFGNAPQKVPHLTTNAHELATSVAFESGLQHFAGDSKSYLSQPKFVVEFLKKVPVAWDEIRYLGGAPGEFTLMARRKEKEWYVAGLNGESVAKTVRVPLSFLGSEGYVANLITDGKGPRSYENKVMPVKKGDTFTVQMAPRGGFTALITIKR
jgi:alpha-glucosidase